MLSYWGHLVTARFGACGKEKNRMSCVIAASAPTNDLAQIRFCTLWVCKQPDYAMHSRFKQLKFSLDIPQVHSGHFAIHFWPYGYRSLPYVSSSHTFPMCHQARLLALILPKNRVVFKTRSGKNRKKRRCGIIPDTNYTNIACV